MYLFHDSRQIQYRTPFGAAKAGAAVTLFLKAQLPQGSRALLRLWQDGETLLPMQPQSDGFSLTLLPKTPGILADHRLFPPPPAGLV